MRCAPGVSNYLVVLVADKWIKFDWCFWAPLFSAKCKISGQNKNGDTALHISAAMGKRKLTRILVEAGVMTGVKNNQGESAVNIARRKLLHHTWLHLQLFSPVTIIANGFSVHWHLIRNQSCNEDLRRFLRSALLTLIDRGSWMLLESWGAESARTF